ncbi:MAG TPA: 5'-deoxyadenosine deaminase [Pyrinomonadaceae bacterium]|nr:5'-deoxyadenosine deaminase [Pyrinomonadaceae bacterium]
MSVTLMQSILIKNGTLLTIDENDSVVTGDLLIRDGRIARIGDKGGKADLEIDASGCAVLPGFVQTHIHLCQTLFRGSADDLSLLDWLKKLVWPMEASHTPSSIRASANLGVAEMIKGGTTCALTMETVNHTEEVFKVIDQAGFRAIVGKCMMDKGDEVPAGLHEETEKSIAESLRLLEAWNGKSGGRIGFCFAPRFALSCTDGLLKRVAELAREHKVMIHTHASENKEECEIVKRETGLSNVSYLDSVGISGGHVVLAHCVHLDRAEFETLRTTGTNVAHCPSSNLKLGSGIAEVSRMLDSGISVSLGADGAACNNRLDMFTEMRTMALLQKALHGPEVLPAKRALRIATIDGAKALGLQDAIGSLEAGKRADVSIVSVKGLQSIPNARDLVSAIVYSGQTSDVQTVVIDGRLVMKDRNLLTVNEAAVISEAEKEAVELRARAGITD